MPSVTSAIQKLIASIFHIFTSILNSIFAFFQGILALCEGAFATVFALLRNTLSFVYHNLFVIVVVGGAFLAFGAYQQRIQQGKPGVPSAQEVQAKANDMKNDMKKRTAAAQ